MFDIKWTTMLQTIQLLIGSHELFARLKLSKTTTNYKIFRVRCLLAAVVTISTGKLLNCPAIESESSDNDLFASTGAN